MNKYSDLTETEYLYGVKVIFFLFLPYKWAIKYKLKKSKALYRELYLLGEKDFEDIVREFKVEKAVKHNEKLLREIPSTKYVTAITRAFNVIVIHTIGKLEESFITAKKLFKSKR